MKKILCFLLVMVSMAGLVCTVNAQGEYDEMFEIDWIGWTGPCDNDGAVVQYINEKFNVKINMWNVLGDALNTRIAAGEIPDVIVLWRGYVPTYADQGLICGVPWETIAECAPNLYAAYIEEMPDYMGASTYDGVNWGLPIIASGSGGLMNPIIYRGDWMQNVGIDHTPATLEELEELVYKFTFDDPDGNGEDDTYGLSASMMDAVYGAYGYLPDMWLDNDEGEVVWGGVQPEMKEALAILQRWYADGVISPEWVVGENDSMYMTSTPFLNGVIGSTCHTWQNYIGPITPDGCGYKLENFPDAWCEIGMAPTGPEGKSGVFTLGILQDNIVAFGIQLADEPDKLKRILEIYDYICGTKEGHITATFGFEGQQWDYVESVDWLGNTYNAIQLRPEYSVWAARVAIGSGCELTNAINFPSIRKDFQPDSFYRYQIPELTAAGYQSSYRTYLPVPADSTYMNELGILQAEYYNDIILGKRPLDDFDEFVELWYQEGGTIVTDEYNTLH